MDYKKKYETLVEAVKTLKKVNPSDDGIQKWIEDNVPELQESEDEKIRKEIIDIIDSYEVAHLKAAGLPSRIPEYIAWLEKQGEHANFLSKIQVSDKVTRNEDGVLVNLSQLNRVAKKQGEQETLCNKCKKEQPSHSCQDITALGRCAVEHEQKPADKVEPKFHKGDWVVYKNDICQIVKREEGCNKLVTVFGIEKELVNERNLSTARLWTIQDAKDCDVLATKAGGIFIYKGLFYDKPFAYCGVDKIGVFKDCNCGNGLDWTPYLSDVTPATKEQCDTLMKAMADAGYTFDFDKKELKKIEDEEYNGKDYGIDSLFHAQRILEKTLGSVEGYQSDDGILEHKCAITAIKKLYEQKSAKWGEEDK